MLIKKAADLRESDVTPKELFLKRREFLTVAGSAAVAVAGTALAPVVTIAPPDVFYGHVSAADVPEIVRRTVARGEVIERLATVARAEHVPFFSKQLKVVLRNCGEIDPLPDRRHGSPHVGGGEVADEAGHARSVDAR